MRKIGLIFGLALLLVSCAVVNVYVTFPQEKIDKAMENLQLDIRKGISPSAPTTPALKKQSHLNPWRFLEPAPLCAQTITSELKISSPVIDEAKARMGKRFADIQRYKDNKNLGENKDGLLDIRSTDGLDGKQTTALQRMVKEENNDRMTIYREIVKINSMDSAQIKNVQTGAARSNRKLANDGEWIQNENGAWQVKKSGTQK